MAEYSFNALKNKEKVFTAMTGLTIKEFDLLLISFKSAYRNDLVSKGKRPNETRGRSDGKLSSIEDKLFFILFYLKTYPLQEILAYTFELPQSTANHWVHRLSLVLKKTLADMNHAPARLPTEFFERLEGENKQDLIIDGTERKIQRPTDNETQKKNYSGKKKSIVLKIMSSQGEMTEKSSI